MAQVRQHTESTRSQYGLADTAAALGWPPASIEVIDTDLGISGKWGVAREGFTELVTRVCTGEVGAIFGIEITRLARSNANVARLAEFARITGTLLIDPDGVYDPADVNDRVILGFKGTMGEMELHVMAQRLQANKRAAAQRGELHTSITERPRAGWPVLIKDHHESYITWADYLANEARLAANHTAAGARPPREGTALCQGIIGCGSCGKPVMTNYHTDQRPAYECSSRRDRLTTPSCRSVAAACVDAAVAVVLVRRSGAGGIFSALRTRRMVDAPTRWPSLSSSPWIRWYPHEAFSVASRSISAAISALTGGRPIRFG